MKKKKWYSLSYIDGTEIKKAQFKTRKKTRNFIRNNLDKSLSAWMHWQTPSTYGIERVYRKWKRDESKYHFNNRIGV